MSKDGSILALFKSDHRRLDRLFEGFQELKLSNFPEAARKLTTFQDRLKKHIEVEERFLFSFLERKLSPRVPELIAVFCAEHRRIKQCVQALRQKIFAGDLETALEEQRLFSALIRHGLKEEEQVFPLLDHILSEREKQAVFRSFAA